MTLTPFSRSQEGLDCWKMGRCPLSALYLLIEWTYFLAKLTQIYHWEGEKCWLDFGDLDPIFKVTLGLRLLENGLSAAYLLKEWIDFNQTCTSILPGHVKDLIRFWWPWLHFQGHRRALIVGKWLVRTLSLVGMNRFWPNMHIYLYNAGTCKRTD